MSEPTVYDGRELICKKHGHELVVVYKDGFNMLVVDRNRYKKEAERLAEKLEGLQQQPDPKSNRLSRMLGSLNVFKRRLWRMAA